MPLSMIWAKVRRVTPWVGSVNAAGAKSSSMTMMVFRRGRSFFCERIFFDLLGVLHEGHRALRVLQDVAGLVGHGVRAARDVGGADAEDGEVGDDPFLAVVGDDADVVSAFHPEVEQARAEARDQPSELPVRDLLPRALVLALRAIWSGYARRRPG